MDQKPPLETVAPPHREGREDGGLGLARTRWKQRLRRVGLARRWLTDPARQGSPGRYDYRRGFEDGGDGLGAGEPQPLAGPPIFIDQNCRIEFERGGNLGEPGATESVPACLSGRNPCLPAADVEPVLGAAEPDIEQAAIFLQLAPAHCLPFA